MTRPGMTWLTQLVAGAILALVGGALAPSADASCSHGRPLFRSLDAPKPAPCEGDDCVKERQPPRDQRPAGPRARSGLLGGGAAAAGAAFAQAAGA